LIWNLSSADETGKHGIFAFAAVKKICRALDSVVTRLTKEGRKYKKHGKPCNTPKKTQPIGVMI
jgi:hypothetical protein